MIGVYAIHCSESGRSYIGSSTSIHSRVSFHFSSLKRGVHYNSEMQLDFDNYGIECFSWNLLVSCDKESLLLIERELESLFLNTYNSIPIRQRSKKNLTKLYEIMAAKGKKTKWLAEEIGVTPQSIRNYMNGDRKISLPMKRLISQALDVDVKELEI